MKSKGFTLVELMLAVSIFSIFAVFMYKSFFDEQRFFLTLHRQIDLQYNADTAVDYIIGEIRNNAGVYLANSTDNKLYASNADNTQKVLVDFSGSGSSARVNVANSDRTLKDSVGNTLCRNIDSVAIAASAGRPDVLDITVKLSSGSGSRLVDYTEKASINIKK